VPPACQLVHETSNTGLTVATHKHTGRFLLWVCEYNRVMVQCSGDRLPSPWRWRICAVWVYSGGYHVATVIGDVVMGMKELVGVRAGGMFALLSSELCQLTLLC